MIKQTNTHREKERERQTETEIEGERERERSTVGRPPSCSSVAVDVYLVKECGD